MGQLSTYDLAVVGGRLITPEGARPGVVAVRDGKIAELLPPGVEVQARRVIDAAGRYVLPGLIDSHVHFRTPGLTHKEDWAHGSRAAAAGGMTTVIDMPNTVPPLLTRQDAHDKDAIIAGSSLVDYRFHAGVDPARPWLLKQLTEREAVSAKLFMAGHHTAPLVARDDQLDAIFATAAECGLRLAVHAEAGCLFDLLDQWRGEPGAYSDFEAHRPRTGAIVAAAKVIEMVRRHGTAAHLVHVSTAEEADLLTAAAHAGLPITFEVTPHHLSFTRDDTRRLGARIRLSPAIRTAEDQDRLWAAVMNEEVATIGSDHAPHLLEEKGRPVAEAPPGLPGVQEMLPALFTGMARRRPAESHDERLMRISRLLGANPARLFGLTGKGRLSTGADADLVVFDPEALWSVTSATAATKCGWSAYEGWMFQGRADITVRRGEVIFDQAAEDRFGAPDGTWLRATRSVPLPEPAATRAPVAHRHHKHSRRRQPVG